MNVCYKLSIFIFFGLGKFDGCPLFFPETYIHCNNVTSLIINNNNVKFFIFICIIIQLSRAEIKTPN